MDQEERTLRQEIAEQPQNAFAMAQLSCLIAERADSATNRSDHDVYEKEALALAHRSIEVAPQERFGYHALSMIHPEFDMRMEFLRKAVERAEDPCDLTPKIDLLVRLLLEPRDEEARLVTGTIGNASKEHPVRKDLTDIETILYERLEKDLQEAWSRPGLTPAEIDYLALRDFRLGIFFRKRDPCEVHQPRAVHHMKRVQENLPKNDSLKDMAEFWLATMCEATDIKRCPAEYVTGLFDSFADSFDDWLVEKLEYRTPTVLRELFNRTVDIKHFKRAIDLGCGTGLSGMAFRDCVDELIGIDLSSEMIEKAWERNCYDDLDVGEVDSDIGYGYDLVLACDVFVYLGDLSRVFTRVYEALADKGVFAFSTELLSTKGDAPFVLHACARFAHRRSYIESLAKELGFTSLAMVESSIRKNQGEDVDGLLVILQK